jgi:hypothetical protein
MYETGGGEAGTVISQTVSVVKTVSKHFRNTDDDSRPATSTAGPSAWRSVTKTKRQLSSREAER